MTDHDLASQYPTTVSIPGVAERNDYDWGLPVMVPYGTVGRRRGAAGVVGFGLAVMGLCATLSGLLAPEGLVIALIGGVLCATAAAVAPGAGVGRGLALVGLFTAVVAMGIGVLAMTRLFAWPNSAVDEVGHWHAWLVTHLSWLRRWV